MAERLDDNIEELSYEMFLNAMKKVSLKHKDKYQYILRAGNSLLNAIFSLYSLVWKKEDIPESWSDSLLVQLPKSKAKEYDLNGLRHIHLKEDLPKLFRQIVTLAAKDNLINNMSKFQIATKPGHRASEHLYVILSIVEQYEKKGKALIISMYDLSKYFDRENLFDCCTEVYKNQVKGKVYRLLFLLNKNIRIRVKTPVGVTQPCDTGPGMGQGTSDGAIVSAVNLDNGVRDRFHEETDENIEDDNINEESENEDEKLKHSENKKSSYV